MNQNATEAAGVSGAAAVEKAVEKASNAMKNMISNAMDGNCYLIIIYLVCIIFLIIFTYSIYLKNEFSKGKANLKKMKTYSNEEITSLQPLTTAEYDKPGDYGPYSRFALLDYHIKSSFNSCCTGPVINGQVHLEALSNVINQGVRFLDFEIYLRKNEAVVAAGRDNIYIKDTLNELNISSVLERVKTAALESAALPNRSDPLILNFRIMSANNTVYDILANSIKKILSPFLMSANYGFCGENIQGGEQDNGKGIFSNNVLFQDLKNVKNKVIIFVKGPPNDETSYKQNKNFYELANGGAQDGRVWYKKNYEVTNDSQTNNQNGNKNHYCITYPDVFLGVNSNAKVHLDYGCQAIMMNFGAGFNKYQMKIYKKKFTDANRAFVLKKKPIRRLRKFAKKAKPQANSINPLQRPCSIIPEGTKTIMELGLIPGGAPNCA